VLLIVFAVAAVLILVLTPRRQAVVHLEPSARLEEPDQLPPAEVKELPPDVKRLLDRVAQGDVEAISEYKRNAGDVAIALPGLLKSLMELRGEQARKAFFEIEMLTRDPVNIAVPMLRHPDPELRNYALATLQSNVEWGELPDEAVPHLVDFLDPRHEAEVRRHAADTLRALKRCSPDLARDLIAFFGDNNGPVRALLAEAVATGGAGVVPLLAEVIQGDDETARSTAVHAFATIGEAGVPRLMSLLREEKTSTLLAALDALDLLGEDAVEAAPTVAALLRGEEVEVRCAAAKAFGGMGAEPDVAVSVLRSGMRDAVAEVRVTCIRALGELGADAEAALPDLVAALDRTFLEQQYGLETLARLGPAAAPALDDLLAVLERRRTPWRKAVFAVLAGMGEAAAPAENILRSGLTDEKPLVRVYAAQGLYAVTKKHDICLPILLAVYREHPGYDRYVLGALKSMGPGAGGAFPEIIERRPRFFVWRLIRDVAEHAGASATPGLIRAVESSDPRVRMIGLRLLERLGPQASEAVAALVRLLDEGRSNSSEETVAARALGRIGPAARDAIPTLERIAADNTRLGSQLAAVKVALHRIRQ
jgi:HEAT repeat protein